jgi:transposase InsO family protein
MVRGRDTRELVRFRAFRLTAAGGAPEAEHVRARHLLRSYVPSHLVSNPLECKRRLHFTGPCPGCLSGATSKFHRLPVSFGSSPQQGICTESLRPAQSLWSQIYEQWSRALGAQPALGTTAFDGAQEARGPPYSAQPVRPISMGRSSVVRSGLNSAFAGGQEQDLCKRSLSVRAGPFM